MIRVLLVIWALAPFQCASDPAPNQRLEDSPGEALWNLSERFAEEGDEDARRTTLRQLVEHYPGSRYARRARSALGENEPAPEETAEEP